MLHVLQLLEKPNTTFVVLEKIGSSTSQKDIIGSVVVSVIHNQSKAFFGMLAVEPSQQGNGLCAH
jgi:hypothetical protein